MQLPILKTAAYVITQWCNSMQVVRMLLEQGASVNAIDTDGCTALHLAAQDGHERIVRLLLRNGAVIDALDRQGRTAGDLAQEHGHTKVTASLAAFQQEVSSTSLSLAMRQEALARYPFIRSVIRSFAFESFHAGGELQQQFCSACPCLSVLGCPLCPGKIRLDH